MDSGQSDSNSAAGYLLGMTKPPESIVSASLPDHRMTAADLSKNNHNSAPAAQPDASQTLHASVSPAGVNNISTIYPAALLSPSADAMGVDLSLLHHQQHTLVASTNTPTSMISDTQTGALVASISPLSGAQSLAQQQLDALTSPSISAQLQNIQQSQVQHANLLGQTVVNPSAVTPGLQAIQAQTSVDGGNANSLSQQQQAALMAAINAGTGAASGGITPLQPQGITALGNSGHTRSTSVVDAAVAMYPNGSTTAGETPQGGLPVLPQGTTTMDANVAQQLTIQLQQQIQQQEQLLQASRLSQNLTIPSQSQSQSHPHTADNINASGVTSNPPGNASTNASGNQSGIQSPFANGTLPATATAAAATAPAVSSNGRHQRHLSNIFPSTVPPQTQQALFVDTPVSLSTAPETLVPGTPTQFGQLPLLSNAHVPGTATAPHPHPYLNPHLGHSRHLSLDTVNLGLMNTDVALIQQQIQHQQQQSQQPQRLVLQETIHEHPSETLVNPTAQVGASNTGQFTSTSLQHQELQQQLKQLQQLQAQHKAIIPSQNGSLLMARTVPATPQNPISLNGGTAVFGNNNNNNNGGYQQLGTPTDVLAQQQIQPQMLLQPAPATTHGHHHHHHHHGSASVDLGSLSSFNINQLNSMFGDQAVAVAAAAASLSNGVQPANTTIPNGAATSAMTHHILMSSQVPQASIPNSVTGISVGDTAIMEELYEDDEEEDDDEGEGNESGTENNKAMQDSTAAKSQAEEGVSTDKPKHKRTPSKVQNSGKVNKKRKAPYKRFRNSFIFFANERRRQWRQDHPEVNKIQNRGFIQEMSKVWNSMSATEKAPYVKMADADKLRYQADVKRYGRLPSRYNNEDNAENDITDTAASSSTPKKTQATASVAKKGSAAQNNLPTPVSIAPAPPSYNSGSINPAATIVSHQQRQRQQLPSFPSSEMLTVNTTDPMLSSVVPAPATAMMGLSIFPDGITSPSQASATGMVGGGAAVQTTPSVAVSPPSAVDVVGSKLATPVDPTEADANVFSQAAYQELLKQTFGQDISPLANEFDPSCFISTAATAVDSGNSSLCLDPASLTPSVANSTSESQMLTPKDKPPANSGSAAASSSSSPSKNVGSGSATITSMVGTKRKRSIDGQFMTSLPTTVKRFRNSFIYYVNEKRRELQQHAGFSKQGDASKQESTYRDFIKNMSAKWREMTEKDKAPYMQMANEDKERFNQQMREYEQEHPEEVQAKGQKHKRRRSSITGFNSSSQTETAAEFTPILPATNGNGGGLNITMDGGSSYTTPLTTPLLGPNSDASALADGKNFSSLPPVPEETVTAAAPAVSEGDNK